MPNAQVPPKLDEESRPPVGMEVLKYNSTAHYLEDLTRKMIAELLTPDFRNSPLLLRHEHEDFMFASTGDGINCPLPYFQGRQNHFDAMEQLFQQDPTYTMEVHNPVALVHRGTRKAEVYSMVLETQLREELLFTREYCCVSYWERRLEDGVWIFYR